MSIKLNKNSIKLDIEDEILSYRGAYIEMGFTPKFLILSRGNRLRLFHKVKGPKLETGGVEMYAGMEICIRQDFEDRDFVTVAG